jgi:phosphatidylserine decarboxylase
VFALFNAGIIVAAMLGLASGETMIYKIIPVILITRLAGALARTRCKIIKSIFISKFAKHFKVNMAEAQQEELSAYASFHDFFIRKLKPDARAINYNKDILACPVDGAVSEIGTITDGKLLQAKGMRYSAAKLLASDKDADYFAGGLFATIYLSPKDYHRVHMPYAGKLLEMTYIPGKLLPVKPSLVNAEDGLFANNERLVAIFEGEFGKFAMVMVGAMIVGKMATVWHGNVRPAGKLAVQTWDYSEQSISLEKGEEMGYFSLGSTVILLLPKDCATWDEALQAETAVRLGEKIAELKLSA